VKPAYRAAGRPRCRKRDNRARNWDNLSLGGQCVGAVPVPSTLICQALGL